MRLPSSLGMISTRPQHLRPQHVRPQHVRVHVAVTNARVSMPCAKGQAHVKDKALAHWQDVKGKGAGDGCGSLLFCSRSTNSSDLQVLAKLGMLVFTSLKHKNTTLETESIRTTYRLAKRRQNGRWLRSCGLEPRLLKCIDPSTP